MQSKNDVTHEQDAATPNGSATMAAIGPYVAATSSWLSTTVSATALSAGATLGVLAAPVAATTSMVADELSNQWASWRAWPWGRPAQPSYNSLADPQDVTTQEVHENDRLTGEVLAAFLGLPSRHTQRNGNAPNLSEEHIISNFLGGWNREQAPTPSSAAQRLVAAQCSALREAERAADFIELISRNATGASAAISSTPNNSEQELSFPIYQESSQPMPDSHLYDVHPVEYNPEDSNDSDMSNNNGM